MPPVTSARVPTDTSAESTRQLLQTGELEVEGQLSEASNLALRVWVSDKAGTDRRIPAVYKPIRGERPLWDFPDGSLAGRELSSYLISQELGWPSIPTTVMRQDGPFGPGSLQQWVGPLQPGADDDLLRVDALTEVPDGYLPVLGLRDDEDDPVVVSHSSAGQLRRIALLDVVLNNADRKGSALIVQGDHVFAIDQGLTLHVEDKLRTVLWGFAGEPLSSDERSALGRLLDCDLDGLLQGLIRPAEIDALRSRVTALLRAGRLPAPPDHRHPLPWPLW